MKKDLRNTTFIIPLKIESTDRLRNAITICCFLLKTFDTQVLVKEQNTDSVFENQALPQITEFLEGDVGNLKYFYEKENDHSFFHKTRYFNELLSKVNTPVVSAYDIDVLLPISSYLKSQEMIMDDGYDLVYPFPLIKPEDDIPENRMCKQVFTDDTLVSNFLSEFDFSIFDSVSATARTQWGHVQFFKTSSYIEGGMENENFKSWGPEDQEKHYRFPKLGYNVGRFNSFVYHLEHSRGKDSETINPYFKDNMDLFSKLETFTEEELKTYYNNQTYLRNYS
tara:strand:+ start:178 stop:1020 length:843 start_codon:yes stop_codon:yes gene_type:complete